jgi:hypothetical protein
VRPDCLPVYLFAPLLHFPLLCLLFALMFPRGCRCCRSPR